MTGKCKPVAPSPISRQQNGGTETPRPCPKAALAFGKAEKKTFAPWLPFPSPDAKTAAPKGSMPAAPVQAPSPAAPCSRARAQERGADVHPRVGEQVRDPPSLLRKGTRGPAAAGAASRRKQAGRQTHGQLPSRTGPAAAGRGAPPPDLGPGERAGLASGGVADLSRRSKTRGWGQGSDG